MLLEVKNIKKTFPERDSPAVNGISLRVKENEFLSILGESGCGKSTLLKLINGYQDLDEGLITIEGERVKGPKDLLILGHPLIEKVDQDYDTFPNHTVRETLEYKLRRFNDAYVNKRINYLLNLFKLTERENSIPRLMSGGEQQRVAFASAIAKSPKLLLMDEPLSQLDPALRRRLKNEIKQIVRQEGISIVFVTHDTQDALALSDRIVVMKSGKIVQTGTPDKLYFSPKSKYVAEFFGPVSDLRAITGNADLRFVRPEKLGLSTKKTANSFPATIVRIDFWGFQQLIKLTNEDGVFYAYSDNTTLKVDDKVYLTLKN